MQIFHPKYAMFFDFHTHARIDDVGHDFHAENFADEMQDIGVELVGLHAKCNQGLCYYNTKIGIRHPSLKPGQDLFGQAVAACAKRGIRVNAYLSVGLANEVALQHPEWSLMGREGNILHPEITGSDITPYMRVMCINSPYRDYIMALIKEVKDNYNVAGFILDSFNAFPCHCPHCVAAMRAMGMRPEDDEHVKRFAYISAVRLAEDIAKIIEPHKNGYLLNFLGLHPRDNARLGSYMECECLPTNPCWGYDYLPIQARYLRNVRQENAPMLNMTGRFYDWGDFGSLRTDPAIEYDLFFGLANGLRPNVSDHHYPSGRENAATHATVKRIYAKLRKYEPWYENAVNLADLAVLMPASEAKQSKVGATRILSELQQQFDFIDAECDFSRFALLLLPDCVTLDDKLRGKLQAFLKAGGKILATGRSGLNAEETAFPIGDDWGVKFLGKCDLNPSYYRLDGDYAALVPDMDLGTYSSGLEIQALPRTEVAGHAVAPYFNVGWDGIQSMFYTPPKCKTDLPFLTFSPQVAYCPWPLFEAYFNSAAAHLRSTAKLMLDKLLPRPLLDTGVSLPTFSRTFVTGQPGRTMVHFLNYVPELRGKMLIVDDEVQVANAKVKLRLDDGNDVSKVYLAPDMVPLEFALKNGYLEFSIPYMKGYALAVVEYAK